MLVKQVSTFVLALRIDNHSEILYLLVNLYDLPNLRRRAIAQKDHRIWNIHARYKLDATTMHEIRNYSV